MKPRPLVYQIDDSPKFHQEGFEPRDEYSIGAVVLLLGLVALVGAVAILRRIL